MLLWRVKGSSDFPDRFLRARSAVPLGYGQDREGPLRERRASSYEVTPSKVNRDPGTADESLAGQHGCGSRIEGHAAPGVAGVSRRVGGGGGRPRGRRN